MKDTEVIELLKKNKIIPKWVEDARSYHKDMKALIYGLDFVDLLLKIEHIESDKKANARRKYARPIKDINRKILSPLSNVYSATGGSKEYKINSEKDKATILKALSNVRGGYSLERWLENYWCYDLYNVDPSGVMLLEYEKEKPCYPTYKSIDIIRNYESNGLSLNWIIFEPQRSKNEQGKDVEKWRVIDDKTDWLVIKDGESYTVDTQNTFNHPFGYCPGRICSNFDQFGTNQRFAFIDDIKETEQEYLRDRSILTIHKFLNGFSTPFRPKIICPDCHGTKKRGIENCPSCDGKGVILDKDIVDEIIIPIDLTSDNTVQLPTNFAGFISPDLEIWKQYRQELVDLFNEMFETIWGTRESEAKDQTAMGIILNTQPMTSQLTEVSKIAQSHEEAFSEMIVNFHVKTKNKEEKVCNIQYGTNYIVQPPEYLLEQYQKSKKENDSIAILDNKLIEYLTSKFKDNPERLYSELIKKELEPYVHMSIDQVSTIYGQKEAQKKGLFTDWWESLDSKSIKDNDINQLILMRDNYFDEKLKALLPQNNNNYQNE